MIGLARWAAAAGFAVAAAAGAHDGHEGPPREPPGAAAAPTGFVAVLEDEVRDLPRRRIRWDTYWRLCWDAYPGARGYELQVITSEGVSRKLKQAEGPCLRIQVAANENRKSEGLRDRALQLALQSGQLALRVRARLSDGRTSDWSDRYAVGVPTRGGDQ